MSMTAEEQEQFNAYRAKAKAIREGGAGSWGKKKDANSGVPMKPSDLLMSNEFLASYAKKLNNIFGEE